MTNEKTKVLVVDDELEIVDTLKSFLTRKGYDVTGASSGEEALSFLEKKRTDLILLDLKMPGIRGEDVARIVKEKYPATKIIVVTAYSEDGKSFYKENLLEDVLIKPVSLKELSQKIQEVLNKGTTLLLKFTILYMLLDLLEQDYEKN